MNAPMISVFLKAKEFKEKHSYEKFFSQIAKEKSICIFGGGALGKQISKWLISAGIMPEFFCDNNIKMKNTLLENSIPFIEFAELKKQKDNVYVIVAVANQHIKCNDIICRQLSDFPYIWHNPLGITTYLCQIFDIASNEFEQKVLSIRKEHYFKEDYSQKLFELLLELRLQNEVIDYETNKLDYFYSEKQYIVEELINYSKIRSYVDCGAFIGDSLDDFVKVSSSDTEYYLFEMDSAIYSLLLNHIEEKYPGRKEKIYAYPYGVGAEHKYVTYSSDITGGSRIRTDDGEEKAEIVALDEMHFNKKIDFIKMDIEGAEEEALLGAEKIIARDHPVLAISMYHSLAQFVRMPDIVKKLDSHYELYLRHHKNTIDDTVLYAIYREEKRNEMEK